MPVPAFIVVIVLLVAALAFAIVSFTGKNSESDKKKDAQKALATTRAELVKTKKQLGTSRNVSGILGDLLGTGRNAAQDLKSCTDIARQFAGHVVPQIGSANIDQTLVDEAQRVDSTCNTADQSYSDFTDALDRATNRSQ